jgi:hypothetical protein
MAYTPNFTDRRVQARIIKAISFVKKFVRPNKPQSLATRWIHHKDHFGSQINPLSKYLRDELLICIDERYNKDQKITKKYILNELGLDLLEKKLVPVSNKKNPGQLNISSSNNSNNTYSVLHLADKLKKELDLGLSYKDSSFRLWHWLQHYPRADKKEVLSAVGLVHTYDIVCACPTLLHQYAQQIPEKLNYDKMIKPRGQRERATWMQGPMDEYLFYLRDYLKNRKTIRKELAVECEVDQMVIKRIISGLFQGAFIKNDPRCGAYNELDGDLAKIRFLQQHEFIIGLTKDIKVLWQYIKPTLYQGIIKTKTGKLKVIPISGKQKTSVYRRLERNVLESVKTYLNNTNNKYFLEHDGWSTEQKINLYELKQHILTHTGFEIEIDYERI